MRENVRGALTETTFLIMLAVFQPRHGYGIMQFIGSEDPRAGNTWGRDTVWRSEGIKTHGLDQALPTAV